MPEIDEHPFLHVIFGRSTLEFGACVAGCLIIAVVTVHFLGYF